MFLLWCDYGIIVTASTSPHLVVQMIPVSMIHSTAVAQNLRVPSHGRTMWCQKSRNKNFDDRNCALRPPNLIPRLHEQPTFQICYNLHDYTKDPSNRLPPSHPWRGYFAVLCDTTSGCDCYSSQTDSLRFLGILHAGGDIDLSGAIVDNLLCLHGTRRIRAYTLSVIFQFWAQILNLTLQWHHTVLKHHSTFCRALYFQYNKDFPTRLSVERDRFHFAAKLLFKFLEQNQKILKDRYFVKQRHVFLHHCLERRTADYSQWRPT